MRGVLIFKWNEFDIPAAGCGMQSEEDHYLDITAG